MNPAITTLEPVPAAALVKTILARDGVTCSLLDLAPGEEVPAATAPLPGTQILFVLDGGVTVRDGAINTVLNREEALNLDATRPSTLVANAPGHAKLLRIDLPARPASPPIVTLSA